MGCQDLNAERAYHPSKAYFGVARALLQARLPFEFVNEVELNQSAVMAQFQVLVIPSGLGLATTTLPLLRSYIAQGGRVVADMPFGLYDGTTGAVLDLTAAHTQFDDVMGLELTDFQSTRNLPRTIPGGKYTARASARKAEATMAEAWQVYDAGLVAEVELTTARVQSSYADGTPLVTVNAYQKGSFTWLNLQASLLAWNRSASLARGLLASVVNSTSPTPPSWRCVACPDGVQVFVRSTTHSQHVFLLSALPTDVTLQLQLACQETAVLQDLLTLDTFKRQGSLWTVPLKAGAGAWLRCNTA